MEFDGERADFDIADGDDAVVDLEGDGGEASGLAAEGNLAFRALGESEGGLDGGGIEIDVDDFFAVEPVFEVEAVGDDAVVVPDVGGGAAGGDVVVKSGARVAGGGEGVGVGEVVRVGEVVGELGLGQRRASALRARDRQFRRGRAGRREAARRWR